MNTTNEHPAIRRWMRARTELVKAAFMRSWKRVLAVGTAAGLATSLAACSPSKPVETKPVTPETTQSQTVETQTPAPGPTSVDEVPATTVMGLDTSKVKVPENVKETFGEKLSGKLTADTLNDYQKVTSLSFYANPRKTDASGKENVTTFADNLYPLRDLMTTSGYNKLHQAAAEYDPDDIAGALIPMTTANGTSFIDGKEYQTMRDNAFGTTVKDVKWKLGKLDDGTQYAEADISIQRQTNTRDGKVFIAHGNQTLQMVPNADDEWTIGGWALTWESGTWSN